MNLLPGIPPKRQALVLAAGVGVLGLAWYKRTHGSSSAGTSQALYQPADQSGAGAPTSGDAAALLQLDSDITRQSASEINLLAALQKQLAAQSQRQAPGTYTAAQWSSILRYVGGLQAPVAPKNTPPAPSRTPVLASASSRPAPITVADLSSTQRQYFNAWTSAIARANPPTSRSTPSHAVSLVTSRPTKPRGPISSAGVGVGGGRRYF